jgi:hypothetical protein
MPTQHHRHGTLQGHIIDCAHSANSTKESFDHSFTPCMVPAGAGTVEHAHAGPRTSRIPSEGIVFREPPDKAVSLRSALCASRAVFKPSRDDFF